MTNQHRQLQEAQKRAEEAEEINAVEAFTISNGKGIDKASSLSLGALLGQIKAANSFSKIATGVSLAAFKQIKESKEYKALKGISLSEIAPGGKNNGVLTGTWEEFCNLCGVSRSKVDEDLRNLESFGEEMMTEMQQMGLGRSDLRKLRKLPEGDIQAVTAAISDKEEALELIEDMAVKHRKETKKLQDELNSVRHENESNERLLKDKDERINKLDKQLNQPLNEVQTRRKEEEQNQKLLNAINAAEVVIDSGFADLFDTIETINSTRHPVDIEEACRDAIFRLLGRFEAQALSVGLIEPFIEKLSEIQAESEFISNK
ncbi:MarR family transcriptional regulator [Vibrio europaeus]|uniref:MarR family transcriptional regulator n=1 Tax=Vibrio europaeus TaxID=300876 RepID=UPI00233ECE7E|nr:MarR family transcriptional regulator [Vibrio europaeus]MDC5755211.1 MarR family transcriptional regulator [Vibrio europaeus]MDC5775790.1 MarR family transcriptional regulator [Vibrio europaeus]MDC5794928.1 MarR family transcriptional regulator [Vibrio europaeus]MDC5799499.1 MarR family transcriptional regulator [Vibrio europaeus]MDC5817207.1 MarR family transcriptional regulator [Vibrio europaeus]